MTRLPMDEFAAFVGLDWADAKREFSVLEHQPDTIDAWVSTISARIRCKTLKEVAYCMVR
jgi:hypothetical protein